MAVDKDSAKADFVRNGFTVLKGFYSPPEIAAIGARLDRYITEICPSLPEHDALYEDKSKRETLFRLERMEHYDPFFNEILLDKRFLTLASFLLDDEIVTRGVELFGKAPKIGNPTPPHQDGYYFMLEPMNAMTFWIAIDRADAENGCIHYVPGSHLEGMRPHALSNVLGFSQGIVDFDEIDRAIEKKVPVAPGDVIAHHCMTIHRTDANPSDRQRRALGCVYFAKSAKVDMEGQKAYQEMLFDKWKKEGKM